MPRRVIHLRGSGAMLGAERVVLELSRWSPGFGYRPIIAVPHVPDTPEPDLATLAREAGIDVRLLPCAGRFDPALFTSLRRLVGNEGAVLIHSHGYKEDFYALFARTGLPLVATNHNWIRTTRALRLYAKLDGRLLRRFDRVVAVSDPLASELLTLGVAPARLHKISNGIDIDAFPPRPVPWIRHRLRREFGLGEKELVLGSIGALRPEKGHRLALQALAELAPEFPDVRLLLIGDGRERADLHALATALGLRGRVVFAGHRSDVPDLLQCLDGFLLPSLTEGLPIALLEAMASGLPAVASRVGDVPRVLIDGDTGYLVEPGSARALGAALRRLLTDPERLELGRRARLRVKRFFSSRAMAASYCALYDQLLGGPPPRPALPRRQTWSTALKAQTP